MCVLHHGIPVSEKMLRELLKVGPVLIRTPLSLGHPVVVLGYDLSPRFVVVVVHNLVLVSGNEPHEGMTDKGETEGGRKNGQLVLRRELAWNIERCSFKIVDIYWKKVAR